jgi:tRNA G10  N-methylase Trm11
MQLAGAEKNLNWAKAKFKLVLADATKVSKYVDHADYIVTEPFMGKLRYQPAEIENITRGLEKLYLGALKDWQKILTPGGKIVMVFPIFSSTRGRIITGDIVDHNSLSGYNVLARGIKYSRPEALIEREIITLEKK